MSELREPVIIYTFTGDLKGELFVGKDGLPELEVEGIQQSLGPYRPATLPAAWMICARTPYRGLGGANESILLRGWHDIAIVIQYLRDAQREAEEEAHREPDDIDAYKRDADVRGER